eukprot:ANDGO_01979.mRNA.1 hypothetical protein
MDASTENNQVADVPCVFANSIFHRNVMASMHSPKELTEVLMRVQQTEDLRGSNEDTMHAILPHLITMLAEENMLVAEKAVQFLIHIHRRFRHVMEREENKVALGHAIQLIRGIVIPKVQHADQNSQSIAAYDAEALADFAKTLQETVAVPARSPQ